MRFQLVLVAGAVAGCSTAVDQDFVPGDTGTTYAWVQQGWEFPARGSDPTFGAFDLDGDGAPDNRAGAMLVAFSAWGLDVPMASDLAFSTGDLVVLHRLRADSTETDPEVTWRIFGGAGDAPIFDGHDAFDVTGVEATLTGQIVNRRLTVAGDNAVIHLPLFPEQPVFDVPLSAVQLSMNLGGTGEVVIGGAIASGPLRRDVLPTLAGQVATHVNTHLDNQFARTAMHLWDSNEDGTLTSEEILSDPFVNTLISTDVDLDGDGATDGLSLALRFTLANADFQVD